MKRITIISAVLMLSILQACYKPQDYLFTCKEIFDALTITIDSTELRADNSATTRIRVSVPRGLDTANAKISVTTASGVFLETNSNTVANNFILFNDTLGIRYFDLNLRSSAKAGDNQITFQLGTCKELRSVKFNKTYAEKISLKADKYFVIRDSLTEIKLTATVLSTGNTTVTKGTKVTIDYVTQADALNFVIPSPNVFNTDENGQVSCNILYYNTAFTGTYFEVKATTQDINNQNLTPAIAKIYVVP